MKTKNFYLFIFGMIFLTGIVSSWSNQTDGFSTIPAAVGVSSPFGITTNGSDFWVLDGQVPQFVYHFNRTGGNYTSAGPISDVNAIGTPGFFTPAAGAGNSRSVTTNGSDFWIVDGTDDFVYHFDRNGNNCTGVNCEAGFSAISAGVTSPSGITTNGSDFWVVNFFPDKFVYHFDRNGNNCTGVNCEAGFSTTNAGGGSPYGITTNGSDFWVITTNALVYHFDKNGNNQSDGFSTLAAGAATTHGITTNSRSGGRPTDFWITDFIEGFVYHFKSDCVCPGLNQNWEIDMSEACVITSNCNLGTGRLNFTGSGSATLSAIVNTTDMGIPPSGATVFITSAGRLNVY